MNFKKQILLGILLLVFLLFARKMERKYHQYSSQSTEEIKTAQIMKSRHFASQVNALLNEASAVAQVTAVILSIDLHLTEPEIYELLRRNVKGNPLIYGAAIAFEPHVFQNRPLFSPYVYRTGTSLSSIDIGTDSYDYTKPEWEWYSKPKKLSSTVWSEPYFDAGAGNINMVTFSAPFFRGGIVAGVTTVDLDLRHLLELAHIDGDHKALSIISQNGNYVYRQDSKDVGQSLLNASVDMPKAELIKLLAVANAGDSRLIEVHGNDKNTYWMSSAPVKASSWNFFIRENKAKALQGLDKVRQQIILLVSIIFSISLVTGMIIWCQLSIRRKIANRLLDESLQREDAQKTLLEQLKVRADIAEVAAKITSSETLDEIVMTLMSSLASMISVGYGALYLSDENTKTLHLIGGYGVDIGSLGKTIAYGEGLTGQCAVEREKVTLEVPEEGYWNITSGLGHYNPCTLVIMPIVHQQKLLGVIELATLDVLDATQHKVLDELIATVALAIKILQRFQTHTNPMGN